MGPDLCCQLLSFTVYFSYLSLSLPLSHPAPDLLPADAGISNQPAAFWLFFLLCVFFPLSFTLPFVFSFPVIFSRINYSASRCEEQLQAEQLGRKHKTTSPPLGALMLLVPF